MRVGVLAVWKNDNHSWWEDFSRGRPTRVESDRVGDLRWGTEQTKGSVWVNYPKRYVCLFPFSGV